MKKYINILILLGIIILSLNMVNCDKNSNPTGPTGETTGTFIDSRDNHTYKWIKIGTQTWMAENLAFEPINKNYIVLNNDTSNIAIYGYFYDWETALTIAPAGWHLPSKAEWETLVNYLGGEDVAGDKMKEIGTTHWNDPNTGATNSSGFTALASGFYDSVYDNFAAFGYSASWWSSTDSYGDNNDAAYFLTLYENSTWASGGAHSKVIYYAVRCLKD